MNKHPKDYEIGDEPIDALIRDLAVKAGSPETAHLMREIITTAVKLGHETRDKGDLKLVNNALKELRYSLKIFSAHRDVKKVVIFGSARSPKASAEYRMAEQFARTLTKKGYMIVTGGGPGVMEAGNKGAKGGKDFSLNIRLPFEQKPNPYINEKDKIINYKYFFTRKLFFIKETDASAFFPGGFGTNDELFEMLTLIQTGKSKPRPIVLIEPKGSTYWATWAHFVRKELIRGGYINKKDLKLFRIVKTVDEAVGYIEDFYRVYHSIRYVTGLTVLRMNRPISDATLTRINEKFKDILTCGSICPAAPSPKEVKENEFVGLPRLAMNFNMRDYGRLCEMIGEINKDKIRLRSEDEDTEDII